MDQLVERTKTYVQGKMHVESTGHDWWHVERVWKMARKIAAKYPQANLPHIELASLLHDLGDYKITGSSEAEEKVLREAMEALEFPDTLIADILEIIDKVSFSRNVGKVQTLSIEQQIVQDADRLDALGALGIARVFAYGGKKGKPIYDPTQEKLTFSSMEERRSAMSSSVHHFDEKLFLLNDMLNTPEAKKIGEHRHQFMEEYLKEFFHEWEGEDVL